MTGWVFGFIAGYVAISLVVPLADPERIKLRLYLWRHRNDPPVHMAPSVVGGEALRNLYRGKL